jgi:16S rRNA (uracil1498-N3)-methyltransferase
MSQRFYSAQTIVGDRALLEEAEAHHAAHVMRAKPGDLVTLFDGSGCEFAAHIARIARSTVEVEIIERREVDRELPLTLTLGVALPKGDRQRWLVEKAVELGVAEIVPLVTARSIADPGRTKLDRAVIEASKQCGRNRLMQIAPPQRWVDWAAKVAAEQAMRLFAHTVPSADNGADACAAVGGARSVAVAIGPEGGWTEDEANLANAHGWQSIGLGSRVLRVETAAIALASLISQRPSH